MKWREFEIFLDENDRIHEIKTVLKLMKKPVETSTAFEAVGY